MSASIQPVCRMLQTHWVSVANCLVKKINPEPVCLISDLLAPLCEPLPNTQPTQKLFHRHQFFRADRVDGNGVIKVLLGRAHTDSHSETLHHFIHT